MVELCMCSVVEELMFDVRSERGSDGFLAYEVQMFLGPFHGGYGLSEVVREIPRYYPGVGSSFVRMPNLCPPRET